MKVDLQTIQSGLDIKVVQLWPVRLRGPEVAGARGGMEYPFRFVRNSLVVEKEPCYNQG